MITKKQQQVLNFIGKSQEKHKYSPSLEEIQRKFKLASVSTAHYYVKQLENKGYLLKEGNHHRSIDVLPISQMVQIPLLGIVAAGQPIEAIPEKELIAVPKNKLPNCGNIYALRVSGNSMIDENINDGDIVLVKQQETAENGEKVVALIDNYNVTLKKYYHEKGHIRLQPANKDMEPIIIRNGKDISIQGIVLDVIREKENPTIQLPKYKEQEKYKELPINKIICGDVVEVMKKFPSNSVDIVVTSPPYDAVRDYKGFSLDLHTAGKEIYRVLKDGGVAVMVIQDQTKNFGKSLTSFKTIVDWVDNVGFKLFETVIYRKYGAEGGWWNKRFRVDHEYIPIFLKGERPQYFNKEHLKIPSKHAGKTMTGGGTRLTNGIRIATRSIKINPMKCRGTIWEYLTAGDGSRLKHQHPATFPNQLPYDFISCFTPKNGIVLDPFVGSGTTTVAAKNLGYKYIGIDIAPEYCEIAERRIKEETNNQNKLF
ncbi:MAG TPA: transcriptional repressor LexA [Candidatus Paceibacterota bacterium]|jgi:site-specific DNA-methyltransferase (adenine-specific)|nr:transcriptional repressor LexA [Candidatus Paceibacterota bacterium]